MGKSFFKRSKFGDWKITKLRNTNVASASKCFRFTEKVDFPVVAESIEKMFKEEMGRDGRIFIDYPKYFLKQNPKKHIMTIDCYFKNGINENILKTIDEYEKIKQKRD